MSTFTREKQLAFGSILGGLLSSLQQEHGLSDADVVALLLNVSAGQASIARWSIESFMGQAQRAYLQSAAVIRPDAPMPVGSSEAVRLLQGPVWCSACRDYRVDGVCSCPSSPMPPRLSHPPKCMCPACSSMRGDRG